MANDRVVVDFVADMERFTPRVKDAPKQVRDSAAKINAEMNKIGEGGAGGIKGLSAAFGRGSAFAMLASGGAVIGLEMTLRKAGELATTLGELSYKARDGAVAWQDWADGIAKSIPVLGTAWLTGGKIGTMIDVLRGKMVTADQERADKASAGLSAMHGAMMERGATAGLSGSALAVAKENLQYEKRKDIIAATSAEVARLAALSDEAAHVESWRLYGEVLVARQEAELDHAAALEQIADDETATRRKALDEILGAFDQESQALLFSRDAMEVEKLARAGASQEDIRAAMIKRQLADATKTAAERAKEAATAIEAEDAAQRKRTAGMLSALGKEVGEYGLTSRQKQARAVFFSGAGFGEKAAGLGAVGWMAGQDEATEASKKAQDEATKSMERAKWITESMRTPSERYADTMKELNGLLGSGALAQESFARATAAARKELEGEGAAAGAIGSFEGIADTWKRIAGAGMREKAGDLASESTVKDGVKHQANAVDVLKRIESKLGGVAVLGP